MVKSEKEQTLGLIKEAKNAVSYYDLKENKDQTRESSNSLREIICDNIIRDDFKKSRWSGYAFVGVPMAIHSYYWIFRKGRYLKTTILLSSYCSLFGYMIFNVRRDLKEFVKQDNPDANQMRQYIHQMYMKTGDAPNYSEISKEIIYDREKESNNLKKL